MRLKLFQSKPILKSAPRIPYRALTDNEHNEFGSYARSLEDYHKREEFWQQTEEAARETLQLIQAGGFLIGEERRWSGGGIDRDGASCGIFSGQIANENIIGAVDMWAEWGFYDHPIRVIYYSSKTLDESLKFRNYLLTKDIPFKDSLNLGELRNQIISLENERDEKTKILIRLEGILAK